MSPKFVFASHLRKPKTPNKARDFPKPITSQTLLKHVGVLGRGSSLVGEEREREGGRDAIALAVKFSPGSGETRRGRQEQPSAAEA